MSLTSPTTWFGSLSARINRREALNFSALVSAQVIVGLVGLASTRYLVPSDKGLFTGVYLWSLVAQTIVGLSLPNALLYFGAAQQRSRPSMPVVQLLGAASLLCGVGLALFVAAHAPGHLALELLLIPLPSAMLAFEVVTYSALAEAHHFHVYRLTQALLFAALGLPVVVVTHSATLLTGALLLSYLGAVIIRFLSPARAATTSRGRLGVAQLLRWSMRGHAGLTLSLLATRLDILFVTLFLSTFSAGQYAAAAAIPNLLAYSGTALGLALARRATTQSSKGTPGFAAWWGGVLFASTAATAAILIAARGELISGLFGTPYEPAAALAIPLAVALPFWSLAAYESQLLASVGRPIHQTIGQGIATLVLAAGSAYGVAHGSPLVVAWSNVVAYTCSVVWQSIALSTSRPAR
jgi:O-antigen/teichoic acid export membrane protein